MDKQRRMEILTTALEKKSVLQRVTTRSYDMLNMMKVKKLDTEKGTVHLASSKSTLVAELKISDIENIQM
jgi:hypothetical protein